MNHTRCVLDYADAPEVQHANMYRLPGDPSIGGGDVVVIRGMRIRFTRNVDKERGFVNGAVAIVEHVLRKDVLVACTPGGIPILAHPAQYDGIQFMPFSFGYAMTIRRSQGSTLEMMTLRFDRKYSADRGYGYVGAPRVQPAADLFVMGQNQAYELVARWWECHWG